jgi:hypothetical protein
MAVFYDQVAAEGGNQYRLGWMLTALEDPPWDMIQGRATKSKPSLHAKLTPSQWLTTNLAYARDLDLIEEKTKKAQGE